MQRLLPLVVEAVQVIPLVLVVLVVAAVGETEPVLLEEAERLIKVMLVEQEMLQVLPVVVAGPVQ